MPQKPRILFIFDPLADMERQRQVVKHILFVAFVVLPHRVKKGLLVADHKVLTHMVLDSHCFGIQLGEVVSSEIGISFGEVLG